MSLKKASLADGPKLVELMAEFYAEAGYELNRQHAAAAFTEVLNDGRLGEIWLIQSGSEDAGYLALIFAYSMEYGGRSAWLEDLFVRAPFRNTGLATAALKEMRGFCAARGIRAISVEVGRVDDAAQKVYRAAGFREADRRLLMLELAKPAHVV